MRFNRRWQMLEMGRACWSPARRFVPRQDAVEVADGQVRLRRYQSKQVTLHRPGHSSCNTRLHRADDGADPRILQRRCAVGVFRTRKRSTWSTCAAEFGFAGTSG